MKRTLDISHQNINLATIDMKYVFVSGADLAFVQGRSGARGALVYQNGFSLCPGENRSSWRSLVYQERI